MPDSPKKILFVTHLADISGAPLLLLEIIKGIYQQQKMSCIVLSLQDGPLVKEFSKYSTTYIWKEKQRQTPNRLLAKFSNLLFKIRQSMHEAGLIKKFGQPHLIFYNTIVNGYLQQKLSHLNCPNIRYVHELKAVIYMLTNETERKIIFNRTNLFFCVSAAVRQNLLQEYAIPENKLMVVPSPVNEATVTRSTYADFVDRFKKNYKTGDSVIIGVAAGNEWRKGFDLLVPLVTLFFRLYPEAKVHFVWKGFKKEVANAWFDLFDYDKCIYKDNIILLPHDKDGLPQIASFDVHLLLSREDPYPLVVLEAANLEIPTVCFDNAGGAAEFVENDAGFVVPYADLYAICEKLHLLSCDSDLRGKMGLRSKEKLALRHDKEQSLAVISDIIYRYASLQ